MLDIRNVAEAFPPGEIIKEELEARGWTQDDLADITGIPASVISNVINAKRQISPDIAAGLSAAFGTTAQLWMNLETSYQLFNETREDEAILRRARLYELAPVKEMIQRGWIEATKDVKLLEERLMAFMEMPSLDEPSTIQYAAKKSTANANPSQVAWVCRARRIARGISAIKFNARVFQEALERIRGLRGDSEAVRNLSRILAGGGVRLVLVEGLSKGKIDGATIWLDSYSPVVAISLRYDRLDHFWFVLMHELAHVKNQDAKVNRPILDVDLVGDFAIPFEEKTEMEKSADHFAEAFLVEPRELEDFIHRFHPLYSKQKIKNFAARISVHPGIVLGQLQHRKEVDWSHSREMLAKVRDVLMSSVLTDGWGHTLPANI